VPGRQTTHVPDTTDRHNISPPRRPRPPPPDPRSTDGRAIRHLRYTPCTFPPMSQASRSLSVRSAGTLIGTLVPHRAISQVAEVGLPVVPAASDPSATSSTRRQSSRGSPKSDRPRQQQHPARRPLIGAIKHPQIDLESQRIPWPVQSGPDIEQDGMSIAIIDVTRPGEPVDGYSSWIRYSTGVWFRFGAVRPPRCPAPGAC
jgi:hypothetical protein